MSMKLPRIEGRSKRQRYFTLLLIPNNENSMRKWRIPGPLLPLMVILSAIGISSIAFFAYGYFTFQGEVKALQFLQGINATQARQIRQLQDKARTLEAKLQTVDELDQQIRNMVGLEDNIGKELSGEELRGEGGSLEPLLWQEGEKTEILGNGETKHNPSPEEQRTGSVMGQALEQRKTVVSTSRSQAQRFSGELLLVNQIAENFEELHDQAELKAMQLEQLLVEVEERLGYLASIPDYWPVQGRITSTYGWRKNPITKRKNEFHEGLDIAARLGTSVKAAGRGKVVLAGYQRGWGRVLVIDHGNGYETQYSHNSSLLVKVGDEVEKGQTIARIGNSGRSTGSHLDFRIKKDGFFIDPLTLLRE